MPPRPRNPGCRWRRIRRSAAASSWRGRMPTGMGQPHPFYQPLIRFTMPQPALHHLPTLLRRTLPWLAAALALPLQAATPAYLTIGTGPLNGVYYPTGGAICRLLNEETASHGLHCSVQSTSGSLANLKALHQGKCSWRWCSPMWCTMPPTAPAPSWVRRPTSRCAASIGFIRRTSRGKRVDLGNPGSGEHITSQALLDAMGWQAKSFAPRSRIGANLYPGQPSGVNTFAVTAELVALASLPEGEVRTVRDVLSGRLKTVHSPPSGPHPPSTLEGMQGEAEVPRHTGMADAAPALLPEALSPAPATSEALATLSGAAHRSGTPPPATTTEPGASSVLEGAAVEQGGKLTGTARAKPLCRDERGTTRLTGARRTGIDSTGTRPHQRRLNRPSTAAPAQ
ncbi:UNVERIFIED_CONTAM: hypothetical protein K2H54_000094 [Gekko kuhli]